MNIDEFRNTSIRVWYAKCVGNAYGRKYTHMYISIGPSQREIIDLSNIYSKTYRANQMVGEIL